METQYIHYIIIIRRINTHTRYCCRFVWKPFTAKAHGPFFTLIGVVKNSCTGNVILGRRVVEWKRMNFKRQGMCFIRRFRGTHVGRRVERVTLARHHQMGLDWNRSMGTSGEIVDVEIENYSSGVVGPRCGGSDEVIDHQFK